MYCTLADLAFPRRYRHHFVLFNPYHLLLKLQPITEDDVERLSVCLRVLAERSELMSSVFAQGSRQVFADMLSLREEQDKKTKKVFSKQIRNCV